MTAGTIDAAGRKTLRKRMRAARRALQGDARREAEAAIVRHIVHLKYFRSARRIAAFMAFDGEPDLAPLLSRRGRQEFYVPVIDEQSMHFAAAPAAGDRRRNFFGIAEPRDRHPVNAKTLDLVLTPLVAFDDQGVRVGVGRGYYDRCFAFLAARKYWHRPKLLGVAFECQRVPSIEASSWDVPLWGIVTENGFHAFP